MIRGFWQSRLAWLGVAAVTLVLTVAVWIRNQGHSLYIPIIASSLALAIGLIAARLLGNVISNLQNTKAMGLLHVDLDPEKFLAAYEKVPSRLKKGSRSHVTSCAYLADGYAAAGEFDKAIAALCPPYDGHYENDPALMTLYYNNLCAYLLGAGRIEEAESAADKLQQAVNDARSEKPALAENMGQSLRLHWNHLSALRGNSVDEEWLAGQVDKAPYRLRRLETALVLAMSAMNRKSPSDARKYLDILSSEGGRTYYRELAEKYGSAIG